MGCVGLLIVAFGVVYCPTKSSVTVGATFCQIAQPIYWSAKDTRRTKEQADAHNAVGKRLCGWGR